jgi:hypothetical protein
MFGLTVFPTNIAENLNEGRSYYHSKNLIFQRLFYISNNILRIF